MNGLPTKLIISYGDFDPAEWANTLRWVARFIRDDEPTSYTRDELFEALGEVVEAATHQHRAADHVRDARPTGRS